MNIDDISAQLFRSEHDRRRRNAQRALDDLRRELAHLDVNSPTAVGAARNAATALSDLNTALGAINALGQVSSLVDGVA